MTDIEWTTAQLEREERWAARWQLACLVVTFLIRAVVYLVRTGMFLWAGFFLIFGWLAAPAVAWQDVLHDAARLAVALTSWSFPFWVLRHGSWYWCRAAEIRANRQEDAA